MKTIKRFEAMKLLIEEGEVACQVMLASTTKSLIKRLQEFDALNDLKECFDNGIWFELDQYIDRLEALSLVPQKEGYAHDYGIAITGYCYLLGEVKHPRVPKLLRNVATNINDWQVKTVISHYFGTI